MTKGVCPQALTKLCSRTNDTFDDSKIHELRNIYFRGQTYSKVRNKQKTTPIMKPNCQIKKLNKFRQTLKKRRTQTNLER